MKISTEINSAARIVGERKAIELYAKAGFDAWDLSMFQMCSFDWRTGICSKTDHPLSSPDYLKFVRELKQIGLDNGIKCNQSHAPFPTYHPAILPYLMRAIECTAEAGAEICVIHPDNNSTPEENARLYEPLLRFAKSCGVKIATENMWNWEANEAYSSFAACATSESFVAHLDAVNDPSFIACLDIGHAEMKGSGSGAVAMIHALGSRLQALHLHDNDCHHDNHEIPFSMSIDFPAVMKALKEIGYSGYLTLEADHYLSAFNQDNVFEGMKDLAAAAKKLSDLYEGNA